MKKSGLIIILLLAVGCASRNVKNVSTEFAEYSDSQKEYNTENINGESTTEAPRGGAAKSAQSAQAEYRKGHFDLAEAHMNKAIKAQPSKSEYYHNLGLIYLAKNEQRQAIQAFRKGLQLSPEDVALASQLGAIYVKEKDYSKAELALEAAAKKGSKDVAVLNNYAIALTANKKIDEAEKFYEKCLNENPSSHDIMLNYSIFLIDHKQKYKQGLDLLNRLKFVGVQPEARNIINVLENRAKAGLK